MTLRGTSDRQSFGGGGDVTVGGDAGLEDAVKIDMDLSRVSVLR